MIEFIPDFHKALPENFYMQPTVEVARQLLGKAIVRFITKSKFIATRIVETEAYLDENDLSSHSARGKTNRNSAMFEAGGILYVYKIYGIHHCINIVTEAAGKGCAVLIRAVEPMSGIELMQKNRSSKDLINLCNGPAKLTSAFGFNHSDNFSSLLTPKLFIQNCVINKNEDTLIGKRIGITKSADLPLRFYLANNSYVSGKK